MNKSVQKGEALAVKSHPYYTNLSILYSSR
ncbi:hypothetical protein GS03_02329 [Flavobacterium sangjuense]|uniref:Uncharacterized protein n=1 Tax=Flavobacterium sangjuense TaxID=2518177 RepID=A0A4P7PV11_9FLAO|nr:hypothetical protein GS03_02329 [Flavobacterium sangjuense]